MTSTCAVLQNINDIRHEDTPAVLKKEREGLLAEYLKGNVESFLERHTRIIDGYFSASFEKSRTGQEMTIDRNPFSIIALGGYGREELCVHSDIDILFLFGEKVPQKAAHLIKEIVYPLWDIGLEVGHATRSLRDCMNIAGSDHQVLTSLLDARFICGISHLYSELMEQLHKKILIKKSEDIINRLIESNTARHLRFGDSAYMLEPNIKEGQGGLRDYHTMLWIARIMSDIKTPRDIECYGYLSHDEFRVLSESLSFIWHTRNKLHYLTGRKCDQLYFEYQPKVAKTLNFGHEKGLKPVEMFLGELHGKMEFIKQQLTVFLYELGHDRNQTRKRRTAKNTKIEGLEVTKRGSLNFASPERILSNHELLILIFEESANLKAPISAEGKRLIKEFGYLVDDAFRSSATAVKSFERILAAPEPSSNVLNEMLNTGFLEKFLPEIKGIINRIQFDEYHLYPVDRHSLRTVRTIKSFGTAADITGDWLCGNIYQELKNSKTLLWAALLHDIGKSEPGGGHSKRGAEIIRKMLSRMGLKRKKIDEIAFLAEEHLLLIKTATRRDINDEETAVFCAGKIKEIELLKMLYLLTVADSIATGPKAWNDWTFTLLRDFFLKILSVMEKGELASTEAVEGLENKRKKILDSVTPAKHKKDLEKHIEVLPPRYLLSSTELEILEHYRLYKSLGNSEFIWEVEKPPESNTRILTVCAKDRPGLFSKIAGVFTLSGLDIFDARINTWKNNIALDVFTLKPPSDLIFEDEKWAAARENLESALSGKLDLTVALKEKTSFGVNIKPHMMEKPHRIVIDNKSSDFFTIIEVFSYDFPGLLYTVTNALFSCRLDIRIAKIATKSDQVVDVFYVIDFEGQKIASEEETALIKAKISEELFKTGFVNLCSNK